MTSTARPASLPDTTEAPAPAGVAEEYAIVTFADPPVASYEGGTRGLARTKPQRGQRLEVSSPAAQAYKRFLENEHANFRAFLNRAAPRAQVLSDYTLTLNGMAVKLNGASRSALARGPKVKAVEPSWLYRPVMNRSRGIIVGTPPLFNDDLVSHLTGRNVNVGVIDSGIDREHDFFACKTITAAGVYATGESAGGNPRVREPLADSHGTHVAGTIAGCAGTVIEDGELDGMVGKTLSGVAPGANLHDYNVFPNFGVGRVIYGGSALTHDIVDAVEDTIEDGMDVVNMSLGGGVNGPNDVLAQAVDGAVDAGVVFTVSAGNAGPGYYTVGSPGTAANAITVGASTNRHYVGVTVDVIGGADYGAAVGEFDPFAANPAAGVPLALTSNPLACDPVSDLTGKIAVVDRGTCTFATKIANAATAGAVGVIVVNSTIGDPIAMAGVGDIPAVMVALSDREAIRAAASASATVNIDGNSPEEIVTTNEDFLAGFSSRGPTHYTGLGKPDVVAPGVNIASSVIGGKFEFYQGTSMAAPHVAGAAALLLEGHRHWSPADVKSALVTTAQRTRNLNASTPASGLQVAKRGGGRIHVPSADTVPVLISPANAYFGYRNTGAAVKTKSITFTVTAVAGTVTCQVTDQTTFGSGDLTLSNNEVSTGSSVTATLQQTAFGDSEGDITFNCGGTILKVPWSAYTNPPGKG